MHYAIFGLMLLVGIIHFLPITGVLGPKRLTALYGLSFDEPNLEILMRNRAVLFGLVGSFIIYSAFRPSLQALAFIAAFANLLSFLGIAWRVGGYNEAIRRLVLGDCVALVALVIALVLYLITRR